jgi:hypothetical protein
MREQSSATSIPPKAAAPPERFDRRLPPSRGALRRLLHSLAEFWREGVYLNERLLDCPWDREGPLRWRREVGGWRLIGADVPVGDVRDHDKSPLRHWGSR